MSFLESDPGYRDEDDALRDLLEREQQILAMQATEGWTLWRDWIAAIAVAYQDRLLKGRHKDLLDYRYDAGVVEGIRIALGASDALAKKVSAARRTLDETRALSGLDEPLAMMEEPTDA